ncbi:MAG: amidohydrolase family protein [Kiritimatiellaeota bacterium]|nr:amidohydrolase family protein [Kiritimatiellota bacterium]
MKQTWIDTHIHVSDVGPDGTRRERMLENLLNVLDRCDADLRFVISCDSPYTWHMIQDPVGMMEGNRFIYELVRRAPGRLYGSCTINPNLLEESLRVMDVCFSEWGFVQLGEMLQYMMNYRMDSDAGEAVVRHAVKYNVPVQVHLGTYCRPKHQGGRYRDETSGDGIFHIADLLGVAQRVPEAKYVLAHAIGCGPTPDYISWADMFLDVIQGSYDTYPDNFWIEIRDFQCKALPRTIRDVPTNRLLAGTDWVTRVGPPFQPYGTMFDVKAGQNPFPPKVSSFVEFLRAAGATENDIQRIGAENARELFRLP